MTWVPDMTDNTIQGKRDPEYLIEMSEYLNALANPVRLQILSSLETRPMELKEIAAITRTSYENIRKHIDKLLLAGLVRKDAGMSSETMTGIHPVWKYSLAPGGMEQIITNLSMFSKVSLMITHTDLATQLSTLRKDISTQFGVTSPCLYLTTGPEEGKVFSLNGDKIPLGRVDPTDMSFSKMQSSVVMLSSEYKSVSRISRPHARIYHGNVWEIEDCGSTSGTFVNTEPISPHTRRTITDGDLIILGTGNMSARFLFITD
ncbi:transcriptional regulator, ArsR family [Methanospirillum hungatei JF-1]|uniref:Transcriptional regulator, ArsR family n=2 Tax=Methanospirillum hungatei TaxID=2203 RepID=Q2FPV7_METHJ|nr:transcriptional regulator, ArsR family [Methanospirillum hungatei JF-1]